MEKGNLKTGQLLDIKEQRGKLVREYVAGFFGDEPIIKQRLLTPQEARIYREDLAKGRQAGKTESEAKQEASGIKKVAPAGAPAAPKAKLVRRGDPTQKRKVMVRRRPAQNGAQPEVPQEEVAQPVDTNEVSAVAPQENVSPESSSVYVPAAAEGNREFVQALIDNESDKANFKPGNLERAIHLIDRIGYPEMKIYRVGKKDGENEGEFYTQKEYVARQTLGLPIWKAKPAAETASEPAQV